MLLTLILNLGMAAGVANPVPVPVDTDTQKAVRNAVGPYEKQREEITDDLLIIEIIKFWTKEIN